MTAAPDGLDIVASRTGDRLFLHIVNTNRTRSVEASAAIDGATVRKATAYEIADDPMLEISNLNSRDVMQQRSRDLAADGPWTFPAASVTAVELELAT